MTVASMIASPSPQRKILANKNNPVMMSPGNKRRKDVGDYWLGKTLGRGSSGRVKIGIHKVTGEKVAIKIISKSHLAANVSVERAVKREIAVMKLISHPNIMHLLDVIDLSDSPNLYLVLEYVQGGELFEYLVSQGRLSEQEARKYFQQIILGLDYCHRHLICHRDLKPENLLLDSGKNIKIADFGMASLQPTGSLLETSCGSPHYASPEIVNGIPYDGSASDIWSCGIILYALLSGQLPFDDDNIRLLLNKVKVGKYKIPSHISEQARDLIQRILVIDPTKRLTMKQVQSHPWFTADPPPNPTTLPDPPTAAEIGRPVASAAEIDDRILETLKVLWTDLSDENVVDALLNSEYNMQKVTYVLLQRHANSYWQTERDDDNSTVSSPAKRRRPATICAIPERKAPFPGLNEMMAKMTENENARNVPQMSPKVPPQSPQFQPSAQPTVRLSHDSPIQPLGSIKAKYNTTKTGKEDVSPPPPPVPPKPKIIRTGHPFTPQSKPKNPWHFVPIHHNQPLQLNQQPQQHYNQHYHQQQQQNHMSWNPSYDYNRQQQQEYHSQQQQQQQQQYQSRQQQQKNMFPELYRSSYQQQQQQQQQQQSQQNYMPAFNPHFSPSNMQYSPQTSSPAPHTSINHMLSPRAPASSALHHQNYTNQYLQKQQSLYRSNNQDSKLNKIFNMWQRNHRVDPMKKPFMFDRKTLESSSSLWKDNQLPVLSPINNKRDSKSSIHHHHQIVPSSSNHFSPHALPKTEQPLGSPKLTSWLPGLFHFKQPKVCSLECEARDEREAMGKVAQAVEEYMDGYITERQDADGRIRRRGEMKLSNFSKTVKFKIEIFQLYSTKKKFVYRINFIQQQGDAMTLATAVKMVDQTLQTYEHEAELVTTANGWTTRL